MSVVDPDTLQPGEPAWRIALLYPPQGHWTEMDYLALDAGRLVEFDQGCVEVLNTPTREHQRIVQYVYRFLFAVVDSNQLGEVFVAPLPIRLWEQKFREPDVVFVAQGREEQGGYPMGADLVVEVVSDGPSSRRRDLFIKRDEYCKAGISEYWIIDPREQVVTVAALHNGIYVQNAYQPGEMAKSQCVAKFELNVVDTFSAAQGS